MISLNTNKSYINKLSYIEALKMKLGNQFIKLNTKHLQIFLSKDNPHQQFWRKNSIKDVLELFSGLFPFFSI